ncbi:protein wech-like [Mya arenaria]|uniref:protein wech-like n=1 Tax=Mya arenaria TaxID=6604 RepID=UPI0022DF8E28|nr:protein wech-like [Mya arenaria]XP_052781499.1 protein wech-like [Mya arenaria]
MDAVSGKMAPMGTGSVSDHTFCQPCANDDKTIPPDVFCTVCKEFLCSNCARVHRNMKFTKSHPLQDKSTMPSSLQPESENKHFTETCQRHAEEFIKYFCPNHETLLCGDCLAEKEHSSCTIERISQVAKRYKEGPKYNGLKAGLVQVVNDIGNLSDNIQASMKYIDEESFTNINALRKFRNDINQYLDKREQELLEEIEQKKQKSQSLLSELKSNCQDIQAATEKLKAELQAKEVNSNQLFISGTRAIKELVGFQSALKDIRGKNSVSYFKFTRDPTTEQLLASCTAIGRVDQVASDLADQVASDLADQQTKPQVSALNQSRADLSQSQFSKLPDVPVKASSDTCNCFLFRVALLPGDSLLLSDYNNRSLKLVDTTNNKLVSQVNLQSAPWGLCLLPGDRAAVTLPWEKKIQFVSTQENVTLQDVVKVDGLCHGIDFCDDNLIVSFSSPGKIVLMDMKGKVKTSVDKDSSGKPLFLCPSYLTVTRKSQTNVVYVTDRDTNTITKLSMSLEVLQSYQDPILRSPLGLTAVADNQLLVCGEASHNILFLDTHTGRITQLLGKDEGIEWPFSVAYCPQKKMVFVTCCYGSIPELDNFVKVFKVV